MTQVPVNPVVFSTADLPEDQRVELWEGHNADALIGLRCRTLGAGALDATEINVQLGRVHLARVRGSSHVVERDAEMVRRRPAESVALFFNLAGEAFFYHDDGLRTVQPGQLLMCDADRPFMRGFSRGLEELVLKIPRDVFAKATGVDAVPRPLVVDFAAGSNSFAHTLARTVGGAARDEDPLPIQEETLLELVVALTGRNRDDLRAAHRAAAYSYIEQHLRDRRLSATQVAAAVGISTRHLSRVLADVGTTLPQLVRGLRLERARKLLETPAVTSMTIAEVAYQCGFTSAAHFSSAFTARFGERAGEVRRRAVAARAIALR
ncbi:AraC family transcriptional regulator [Streptomyces sp900129855]|uniref:AraC family transcriptional regulator n=1 Tax=Streptomyces sp. 900129855 TaxID=3155129 RepID=A0ABV2ZV57_9ACTN